MKQRGRKSTAGLQTVAAPVEIPRLSPPAELTEFEADVWTAVTATKPADWFTADTATLLLSYCKHISHAQTVDAQIKAFNPEWLADEEGMGRYKSLLQMRERETKVQISLARSMRLTHQARYQPPEARREAGKAAGKKPWQS